MSEHDDVKKENNRDSCLKNKNSSPKQKKQIFVKKVNFVIGNDMKSESTVIDSVSNVEFAKNKNVQKSDSEQTKHNPSDTSSPQIESSSKESGVKIGRAHV